jgi:hypothetical protein
MIAFVAALGLDRRRDAIVEWGIPDRAAACWPVR